MGRRVGGRDKKYREEEGRGQGQEVQRGVE